MNDKNIKSGRVNQKLKTQKKILETAREMLVSNKDFSLDDVAAQMQISRATIYRYYANIDILCLDVAISMTNKDPEDFTEYVRGMTLSQSLLYVQDYFNNLVQEHENQFRKYLSLVLDKSVKGESAIAHRGGRRPRTLEIVMKPFQTELDDQTYINLKNVVTLLCGIEPLISNKDVSGLNNEQSNELLKWALEMILRGVEADMAEKTNPTL
ncbi:TetR/AcrR family transcriptional regulator [Dyadobacter fermentans]|uniref:Transcriptional regulator, TetR family n=1 Tax=Dyadobacter fermentans (strain ATCC 700827 / DSM 18053 / CIP 107007 / KCTC 52180 / NS114) TaxID=471854 RepID=C6VW20_DYAFD|nr:TetR/AcrR family transcriptional regulator [Dyadobacter fermentans]ACT93152.1 transcriptional regulator, TetR family [Dyadobacter fermentans DSM 18053]